jgi:protein-disulfide isomerase
VPTFSVLAGATRRGALALAAAALMTFAAAPAHAQSTVPLDQLMGPMPIPDVVQGAATAPVTIVEYASMTCVHCAAFHAESWPTLKADYVDTGKVKMILREFPLDPLATAGFMLARCAGPDKRTGIVDLLFTTQKSWAFVDKPIEALLGVVKQAGISQSDFDACLKNQGLYDQINQSRDLAAQKFAVDSTPTFFINGRKMVGELSVDALKKAIDPLLK